MTYQYGPIEFIVIGLPDQTPTPDILNAITSLIEAGAIRLLDMVIIARSNTGALSITEVEDVSDEYGFASIELHAHGISADEDSIRLASTLPLDSSALLVVVELSWATHLADALDRSGAVILSTDRVPASIVNETLTDLTS